ELEPDRHLVGAPRRECFLAPRAPVHRLVGRCLEVGEGLLCESVHVVVRPSDRPTVRRLIRASSGTDRSTLRLRNAGAGRCTPFARGGSACEKTRSTGGAAQAP